VDFESSRGAAFRVQLEDREWKPQRDTVEAEAGTRTVSGRSRRSARPGYLVPI
jgi:hypothetical protein